MLSNVTVLNFRELFFILYLCFLFLAVFYRLVAEFSGFLAVWLKFMFFWIRRRVIRDDLIQYSSLIVKGKNAQEEFLPLKMRLVRRLKSSGTDYLMTRFTIPEDRKPQARGP
jgi:hypothetical protein